MHVMEAGWALSGSILENDPGIFLQESTHSSDIFRYGFKAVLPRGRAMDSNTLQAPSRGSRMQLPAESLGLEACPSVQQGIKRHIRSYPFFFLLEPNLMVEKKS